MYQGSVLTTVPLGSWNVSPVDKEGLLCSAPWLEIDLWLLSSPWSVEPKGINVSKQQQKVAKSISILFPVSGNLPSPGRRTPTLLLLPLPSPWSFPTPKSSTSPGPLQGLHPVPGMPCPQVFSGWLLPSLESEVDVVLERPPLTTPSGEVSLGCSPSRLFPYRPGHSISLFAFSFCPLLVSRALSAQRTLNTETVVC